MSAVHFSYFEFYEAGRDVFVSLFKTTKTSFCAEKMPKSGERVFPNIPDDAFWYKQLVALQKNNFGFHDTFWFLPRRNNYTLDDIKEWMSSLVYEPTTNVTEAYGECRITSTIQLDPPFSLTVYVKYDPLPQEAIDVIPLFKGTDNEYYVVLGQKKKSDTVSVELRGRTLSLLSVGLYGKVILGEHLEDGEKKRMEEIRTQFRNKAIKMKSKDVSPVIRTLLEEGGFQMSSLEVDCYYVHFDNRPGRDPRYTVYNRNGDDQNEMFGYFRESSSDTVVVLMSGDVPKELPNPTDTIECDKPIVLKAKDAIRLLTGVDERFTPAFWSHVIQLCIAMNSDVVLSEEEKTVQNSYLGLTAHELTNFYTKGVVRVGSIGGYTMKLGETFDERRINVSVAANGKIDRILGFY